MQAVILAGGQGERLRPLTYLKPKPMIEIRGRPFLYHVIQVLKMNKIKDLVICTGYLGSQIKRYFQDGVAFGINIEYSHETYPLGTGGSLKLTEPLINDDFFLINGDTYLDIDYQEMYKSFRSSNRLMMMAVYCLGVGNCIIGGNKDIITYQKKGFSKQYVDAGVWVLSKRIFNYLPNDENFSLESNLQKLIDANQAKAFICDKRFYDIGTQKGLEEFEEHKK